MCVSFTLLLLLLLLLLMLLHFAGVESSTDACLSDVDEFGLIQVS